MTYSIAQIIQAEAGGNAAGGFAVASTIQNRAQSGLFGTSDPLAIVNQPGQFAGNLTGPGGPGYVPPLSAVTPQNQAYADAIQNGTLSQYGNTGNALYFQSNQGQASTVVGGSSPNIGGNYFSDQMGQPSGSFIAPSYGGANAVGENDIYSDFTGGTVPNDVVGGTITTGDGDIFGTLSGGVSGGGVATGAAGSADFGDLPDNIFDGSTALPSDAATAVSGVNASSLASSLGGAAGGGIPINLTDEGQLPSSVSGAGTAAKAGLTTAGSDVQTAAGGLAGTAASIINSAEAYTSKAIVVIALVLMGAIFVALGLGLFGKRELAAVT